VKHHHEEKMTAKSVFGIITLTVTLATGVHAQSWLTNGLVAYYPFNGNANDASGHGHNGINKGGVPVQDRFGVSSQAYRFDGTNNSNTNFVVDLSQNRPITGVQTSFSICGWIKPRYIPSGYDVPQSVYPARGIYFHRAHWADIGVRINNSPWVQSSPRTLEFITIGGASENLFANQLIPTNGWTAFAATYDGSMKRLYVNGVLNASGICEYNPNWDVNFIGEGIGGNFAGQAESFDGVIDDIRIYNRALSASEVQQLYQYESGPRVNFVKAFTVDAYNLPVGSNYVLEASSDMTNWTIIDDGITSSTGSYTNTSYWRVDDWNKLFFRLHAVP